MGRLNPLTVLALGLACGTFGPPPDGPSPALLADPGSVTWPDSAERLRALTVARALLPAGPARLVALWDEPDFIAPPIPGAPPLIVRGTDPLGLAVVDVEDLDDSGFDRWVAAPRGPLLQAAQSLVGTIGPPQPFVATIPAQADPPWQLAGAPAAWSSGIRGAGSTIVVLDAGVDPHHAAFRPEGRVQMGGCIRVIAGDCRCEPDAPVGPRCPGGRGSLGGAAAEGPPGGGIDHGVRAAGLAAASWETGAAPPSCGPGVAPAASILSIRVLGQGPGAAPTGDGVDVDLALAATVRAAQADPSIAVAVLAFSYMSIGGPAAGCADHLPVTQRLIDRLVDSGVVVVASAGNRPDCPSSLTLPAPACLRGVVSVAAADPFGLPARSCSGPGLSLFAPGDGLSSAAGPPTGCDAFSGSSAAAPIAAGAFALLRERTGRIPAPEAVRVLLDWMPVGAPDVPSPTVPRLDLSRFPWGADWDAASCREALLRGDTTVPSIPCQGLPTSKDGPDAATRGLKISPTLSRSPSGIR